MRDRRRLSARGWSGPLDQVQQQVVRQLSGLGRDRPIDPHVEIDLSPLLVVPPVVVTRPVDLLRLRFEFHNLRLDTVDGVLVLRRTEPRRPAYLVVDHAPQHLLEQAGRQLQSSVQWPSRPVGTRLSGHSRVVIDVGDAHVAWTLDGLLGASTTLPMSLSLNATIEPRLPWELPPRWRDRVLQVGPLAGLTVDAGNAEALAAQATTWARSRRATAALEARLGPVAAERSWHAIGVEPTFEPRFPVGIHPGLEQGGGLDIGDLVSHPTPTRPSSEQTALELPFRLLLSPLPQGGWRHSARPVERGGRVELWHSRLGTRDATGEVRERDARVRAVWTRDFGLHPGVDADPTTMAALSPEQDDHVPTFVKSLGERDRMTIVHETSNFSLRGTDGRSRWTPPPVQVDRLALSSLGGWLDSRFATTRLPASDGVLDMLAWEHLATLGRDQYVETVRLGFLFPFGHRATLVTITERAFDTSAPGTPAFLLRRQLVSVVEPTRTFADTSTYVDRRAPEAQPKRLDLVMPFASVTVLDTTTPLLDPRDGTANGTAGGALTDPDTFFPTVDGRTHAFRLLAVDRLGHRVEYAAPLLFVPLQRNATPAALAPVVAAYRARNRSAQAVHRLDGQAVAFAPDTFEGQPLDTVLSTRELRWDAANLDDDGTGPQVPDDRPAFAPMLDTASVVVPAVSALAGRAEPVEVSFPRHFAERGLADNVARVFLQVADTPTMAFSDQADRSGGFVAPDLAVTALSGLTGPLGGDVAKAIAGEVPAADFFSMVSGAKLFGVVPLAELLPPLTPATMPAFVADQLDRVAAVQRDLARLVRLADDVHQRVQALGPESPEIAAETAAATAVAVAGERAATTLQALLDFTPPGTEAGQALHDLAESLDDVAEKVEAADRLPKAVRVEVSGVVRRLAEHAEGGAELLDLLRQVSEGLTLPEQLSARLTWSTPVETWSFAGEPIFVPRGGTGHLDLVVEVAAPTGPGRAATATASCSLSPFDLQLVGSEPFITLHVERIEFAVRAGAKPDVNVVFGEEAVTFGGPLVWVNALRPLIPFDGFSDPPYLDVTTAGITAGFDLALPDLPIGVLNLSQLSLSAQAVVPFVGESLAFRFGFCSRERPFHLTVWAFGGGGFFAITVTPQEVSILEAAFEFGAAVSVDFGVASGSIEVMAGIYFRLKEGDSDLSGYVRLRGEVDVLGLISASIELYLELGYKPETKTAHGRAQLTIEVEVLFLSTSVTIETEKEFKGSDQDPTFAQVMGPSPGQDVVDSAWADYCTAFAGV